MTVAAALRCVTAPGRGGIPLNPEEEEEEEEGDYLRFPGSGNFFFVLRVISDNTPVDN